MKYFVYFLELNDKRVYVGSTNNIERRIREHKLGESKFTTDFLPVRLLAYMVVPTVHKARELEQYFKKGSGKAVLKKRILSDEALT